MSRIAMLLLIGLVLAVMIVLIMVGVRMITAEPQPPRESKRHTLRRLAQEFAGRNLNGWPDEKATAELEELAPQLTESDWKYFEKTYRKAYGTGVAEQAQARSNLEHLHTIFRRDRAVAEARREIRS